MAEGSVRSVVADLERLFASRSSCRAFLPEPVPESKIARLFEIARYSPSWCNVQPWQVDVTAPPMTGRLARRLYRSAQFGQKPAPDLSLPQGYPGIYGERRREAGWNLYSAVGVERRDLAGRKRQALENFRFFGAPHIAVISTPKVLGPYGVLDCGGYVLALLLAAEAVGLAAIAQAATALHPQIVRHMLGISEERDIICSVAFGHCDTSSPAHAVHTDRAPTETVVRWHRD